MSGRENREAAMVRCNCQLPVTRTRPETQSGQSRQMRPGCPMAILPNEMALEAISNAEV